MAKNLVLLDDQLKSGKGYISTMKLRISNQSIRIRINQDDLRQLVLSGEISEKFGNEVVGSLVYSLSVDNIQSIHVSIKSDEIAVTMPRTFVKEWNETEKVSFEEEVSEVRVLLEKDFQCLTERPYEDESQNFSNPKSQH